MKWVNVEMLSQNLENLSPVSVKLILHYEKKEILIGNTKSLLVINVFLRNKYSQFIKFIFFVKKLPENHSGNKYNYFSLLTKLEISF